MRPRGRRVESAEVATEVKVWMARRRLTQVELAERLGHDHTWVSKRLSGRTAMTVDDLLEFADALDVSAVEFFRVADGQSLNYRSA